MEKLFHCLYSIWRDFKKDIKNLLTAVFLFFGETVVILDILP